MPLSRLSKKFVDLSMGFKTNPFNGDVITITNEVAISRSIMNIVFTLPGEKFFNQNFGSKVNRSLFDNIDDISASIINDEIKVSIKNYEPRVELISVDTSPNYDENAFNVTIVYNIIGIDATPQQLEFVLLPNR